LSPNQPLGLELDPCGLVTPILHPIRECQPGLSSNKVAIAACQVFSLRFKSGFSIRTTSRYLFLTGKIAVQESQFSAVVYNRKTDCILKL
jgi:hypothetical protein